MSAVWALDLGPSEKFVLLALADNANDDGTCWPSVATICSKTSLAERTVRKLIHKLQGLGQVIISERYGRSNVFTVTPAPRAPLHEMHPAPDAPPPLHQEQGTPARSAPTPAPRAPRIIKEPSIEPSVESSIETRAEVQSVFDHYREVWRHPKSALDAKRTAAIRKALKGYSVADLCACISGYQNSAFHTGANDTQTIYDDLCLFLRDSSHIDKGIQLHSNPPVLTSKLEQHNVAVLQAWRPKELRDANSGLSEVSGGDGELERDVWQGTLAAPN